MSADLATTTNDMLSLSTLRSRLTSFTASPRTFHHLLRLGPTPPASSPLHILDSSFNPPTLAHHRLASLPLSSPSPHLLLLLATQNADKPHAPASFPHRLAMMQLLARFLSSQCPSACIDIALTKHARFLDKSTSLRKVEGWEQKEQVWIMGLDTLTRLLDGKYYPEGMGVLSEFFLGGRVMVLDRPGGGLTVEGVRGEIEGGKREDEGVRREWARRIEGVEVREGGVDVGEVSSTRARQYVAAGEVGRLKEVLGEEVAVWVERYKLYTPEAVEEEAEGEGRVEEGR